MEKEATTSTAWRSIKSPTARIRAAVFAFLRPKLILQLGYFVENGIEKAAFIALLPGVAAATTLEQRNAFITRLNEALLAAIGTFGSECRLEYVNQGFLTVGPAFEAMFYLEGFGADAQWLGFIEENGRPTWNFSHAEPLLRIRRRFWREIGRWPIGCGYFPEVERLMVIERSFFPIKHLTNYVTQKKGRHH